MATAIGVIGSILTIFSFVSDNFPTPEENGATINFKVGLDGAGNPPLKEGGGDKPDIRLWTEQGDFLGITINDGKKCESGADKCETKVTGFTQQPTYTLFTGNTDAICLAWSSITFPGGDKYAVTLGNWARACDREYDRGGSWYYSDIIVQTDSGKGEKVFCAWVDQDGDTKTTGIQVHWPEYGGDNKNNKDLKHFCTNDPVLWFRTDENPSTVRRWKSKRDMFAREPSISYASSPELQRRAADEQHARLARRFQNDTRLVKSKWEGHTASGLCSQGRSVGPSFVSLKERKFCYMATKTLYPFCDDVEGGACWNEKENKVVVKGNSGLRVGSVPELSFGDVLNWGED